MRKTNKRRLAALLLTLVLCLVPWAAGAAEKEIAGLGTNGIAAPTVGTDAWTGSFVYYGKYNDSPVLYRVLANGETAFTSTANPTLLLDCDSILYDNVQFDHDSNVWKDSTVRSGLNGNDFLNKSDVFSDQEKAAIAASTKGNAVTDEGLGWSDLGWAKLEGEQVFLLDAVEATRPSYGYKNNDSDDATRVKKNSSGNTASWWLRSPNSNRDRIAGCVYSDG